MARSAINFVPSFSELCKSGSCCYTARATLLPRRFFLKLAPLQAQTSLFANRMLTRDRMNSFQEGEETLAKARDFVNFMFSKITLTVIPLDSETLGTFFVE